MSTLRCPSPGSMALLQNSKGQANNLNSANVPKFARLDLVYMSDKMALKSMSKIFTDKIERFKFNCCYMCYDL